MAGVAFAPFAEEVFFRGYVYRAMSERKGVLRGVVYSSLLFGAIHWNLGAFLPITAGAVLLALSFRRTGHLLTPIVAHALNNAFAFALLLVTVSARSVRSTAADLPPRHRRARGAADVSPSPAPPGGRRRCRRSGRSRG